MSFSARRGRYLVMLILPLLLFACAHTKTEETPRPSPQESVQIRRPRVAAHDQKTIDAYKADYERRPQDQALVKEYVKVLEEIKSSADRALQKEEFSSAVKGYRLLLANYHSFKPFAQLLSFDRAKLNGQVTACKEGLTKKGFQEYRQGNIEQAIALWQDCLAIDPNNADVKKALNTAKAQQRNLRQATK